LEFSSNQTYANRYDLDEIDVFLEGDSSNPMFFNINGLPNELSFGKHYFNLSILDSINQQYELAPNSRILFEFKSSNNVILKSAVTDLRQKNGVAVCFVEILKNPLRTFKEVEDGSGYLSIVGSLQDKENTENPITEKFIGAVNYRCIFPFQIRKNLINADSLKVLQSSHKLETSLGSFSFAKASISSPAGSVTGTNFGTTGAPANQPQTKKGNS